MFIPNICVLIFSFSVKSEELNDVQDFVNRRIESKLPLVEQRNITMEIAINDGALALFVKNMVIRFAVLDLDNQLNYVVVRMLKTP